MRAFSLLIGAVGRDLPGDRIHIEEFVPMAHHEVLDQGPPDPLLLGGLGEAARGVPEVMERRPLDLEGGTPDLDLVEAVGALLTVTW